VEAVPYGVRVKAVASGPLRTAMLNRVTGGDADAKAAFLAAIPQARGGEPDEIADAIVFIASDRAGFLTAQTIVIDGGITVS
jgi:NAD(P)-dependent dehydrogenase (short-subunit alcohol dehydrogenase family)